MDPAAGEPPDRAEGAAAAFWRFLVAVSRSLRRGVRRLRRWNERGGAGASGFATLVETHALQAAGDATITVALAGSLFFSVPTHEARSRVALYLLVTMAPFAVVAPVLGPLLDRVRHGRRLALAVTMLARAVLALAIGHALSSDQPSVAQALTLYPAALGVLVASKSYSIARSATVPRLVPAGMTLVQANARLSLTGAIAPSVAGSLAAAVIFALGHRVELLLGAAVYVLAAFVAMRLPSTADGGAAREHTARLTGGIVWWGSVGADIRLALRSAVALRWLSGFMLLFGAFLVRVHPIGGLSPTICLGALGLGIAGGNLVGTLVGPRSASIAATRLSVLLLAATTAMCVVTVLYFGLATVFALAGVGAAAAAVSKLGLDAAIQRRVDDDVRTSVFARSETTMQLSWVLGGAIGILLPTRADVGFSVAAAVLAFALAITLGWRPRRTPKSRESTLSAPENG